jgi:peptidoglycan hydrolase-like protein with peptidoglycan-binding domain
MDPQGRDLKLWMQGADVLQLQTELRQLGASITDRKGFFGQTTRKAVMDFQVAHGLPATGTVDAAFRQHLAAVLAPTSASTPSTLPTLPSTPTPEQPPPVSLGTTLPLASDGNAPYVVEGEVVQPDGTPLQDYPVRAFDRALGDWRLLGEARTNNGGRYSISYDPEQLKAWGKTRADLKVEAYDAATGDTVLAVSPLILQALTLETVTSRSAQSATAARTSTRVSKRRWRRTCNP